MCAVPLACAEQVPDIIEPTGMSIVNIMSSPTIVPDIVPRIMVLDIPEKLIVPVTFEPVCISCQVMVPIPAWPIIPPVPMMGVVESVAMPAQVPVTDIVEPGAAGKLELPPHAAADKPSSAAAVNALNIVTFDRSDGSPVTSDSASGTSVTRGFHPRGHAWPEPCHVMKSPDALRIELCSTHGLHPCQGGRPPQGWLVRAPVCES